MNITFTLTPAMVSPGVSVNSILRINGNEHTVAHDIRASLLDTLRALIGLDGARQVCGDMHCEACTVHIDGNPAFACQTLTVGTEGQDITTAEGLVPAPRPLYG